MEYETPLRICIMLIESIGTGAAVYWIVRPYIHQYEKGKKFMAAFLILEFVHRVFRAWCYLRVPELDSIKRDTLKYLDKSQGAGDLEYKKEVMEKFDEVLENEK